MEAKSDASDEAAPGRPSAAPARAVVLTSLIQLVAVAMNLRLRHRRSLRAIERNLADSDPSLTKLFYTFTVLAQGEERGRAEKVKARPLRALAHRLAVALEFDPRRPLAAGEVAASNTLDHLGQLPGTSRAPARHIASTPGRFPASPIVRPTANAG